MQLVSLSTAVYQAMVTYRLKHFSVDYFNIFFCEIFFNNITLNPNRIDMLKAEKT